MSRRQIMLNPTLLQLFTTILLTLFNLKLSAQEFQESSDGIGFEESSFQSQNFVRQFFNFERNSSSAEGSTTRINSQSRLRLGFNYNARRVSFEAAGDIDLFHSSQSGSILDEAAHNRRIRNRLFDLEHNEENDTLRLSGAVHRLQFGYYGQRWHLVMGRQAISWGQGRLINPLNLITPTGPLLVDMEDLPGADAVNLTYFFNSTDSLQMVLIPLRQRDSSNPAKLKLKNSNLLLRHQASWGELDSALTLGRHYNSNIWGGEITLTRFRIPLRVAYLGRKTAPQEDSLLDRWQSAKSIENIFVVGISDSFSRGKLMINAEVIHNSSGSSTLSVQNLLQLYESLVAADYLPPLPKDESYYVSNRVTGGGDPLLFQFSIGGEVSERSNLNFAFFYDPQNSSLLLAPQLSVSLSDETVWNSGIIYSPLSSSSALAGVGNRAFTLLRRHF